MIINIKQYCPQCGPRERTDSDTCYWCGERLLLVVSRNEIARIEKLELELKNCKLALANINDDGGKDK